ncbi:unnamed protein product [Medioppia subpectinata]|uniref:Uncharacterized protein n=1 Tax=Medioppia subpectinata TaxID=1979941 RepID=A0A7R9KCV3_9ACAR|nr:unnamed protein product [Medioppia subpectinata]CAG2100893.1 unnamed protein product [Medioppia subpectinata]
MDNITKLYSMWDSEARKYSTPYSGANGFNNSEDLHAWSIYRQNLNADFSESALGVNKSNNSERPFGNFQLKETTVNNILNHPKYGPRFKNQDAYTYLRFGLPRVKTTQSEIGGGVKRGEGITSASGTHPTNGHIRANHHMNTDSSNASDSPYMERKEAKRTWKSDPDLLRTHTESALMTSHYERNHRHNHQRPESKHITSQSLISGNNKSQSETDLRFPNSKMNGAKNEGFSLSKMDMSGLIPAKHPHLIVSGLYYELDKSSTWRRLCGVRRQKLKCCFKYAWNSMN